MYTPFLFLLEINYCGSLNRDLLKRKMTKLEKFFIKNAFTNQKCSNQFSDN